MTVRVVDAAGRPVAGLPVVCWGSGPRSRNEPSVDAETDPDGRAAAEVGPGPRGVMANVQGQPGYRRDLWMAFLEFTAEPGAQLSFELVVPARDASLAVQVVDDLGAPIPGVHLSLPITGDPHAETDAQGRAFFAQLPPVGIRVDLKADDELRQKYGVPYAAAEHVELKAGETCSARFVLPRTGSLRVLFEPEEGIDPQQQLQVSIHSTTNDYRQDPWYRGVRLEEPLHVEGLAPQEYQLSFEPAADAGFSLGPMRRVRVLPGDTAKMRVAVRRHAGVVSGLVLDTSGQPVGRVYLFLIVGDYRLGDPESRNTRSAADGSFRIEGVPQVPITLGVDPAPAGDRNLAHFGTFEEPHLRLQGPMEGVRLVLQPGYAIRGTVRTTSGRAVKSGSVWIDRKRHAGSHWTNLDNDPPHAFELRNLRPGEYTIWYDSGDERKQAERVVSVGPEVGDAEVELVVRTR